jgi:ATP-dependent Clp protease protease subunit
MTHHRLLVSIAFLGTLLQGCVWYTPDGPRPMEKSQPDARVDFTDPLLNRRQIFLFGAINQRVAELTIQKLLFLDGKSHDPIDLYLQTPGGEVKSAMAIEQTIRVLQSPVNTYALSECNSGGALLLAAGTGKRRAFQGALVVLHGITIYGKAPPEFTKHLQDGYTQFWRRRARLPDSWLPLPLGSERILTADQALEHGIVDEIIGK